MLKLKEEVEDPSILKRIHDILIPREFTRLDPIVEIAFAIVEDAKTEDDVDEDGKKFTPVAFHSECLSRIEKHLNMSLIKQSRASFATSDQSVRILCTVSRFHERNQQYWFAFHPYQKQFLSEANKAYIAFGCGNADNLFLIPLSDFQPWLDFFLKTEKPEGYYWHVKIKESGQSFWIVGRSGTQDCGIDTFRI